MSRKASYHKQRENNDEHKTHTRAASRNPARKETVDIANN